MVVNTSKSHFMLVNAPFSLSLAVNINEKLLAQKPTSWLFGFVLNSSLTWTDHIQNISNKIASSLRLFYNIKHLMNFITVKQYYYYNYIHSYLTYGIRIFYPSTPSNSSRTLFILQKKALRLICKDLPKTKDCHLPTKVISRHTSIMMLP